MMKTLILFLSFMVCGAQLNAQQMTSYTTIPANPTTNDFVKIKVEAWFPSGSCELFQSNVNQSGNNIYITFLHCLGMLTVICNQTDTFDVGYLNAGTYQVNLNMQTGGLLGPTPCSASATTTATFSFNVTQAVGLNQQQDSDFQVYITNGKLQVKCIKPYTEPYLLKLINIQGQLMLETQVSGDASVNLPESVTKGSYIVNILNQKNKVNSVRVFID